MSFLKKYCPECGKVAEVVSDITDSRASEPTRYLMLRCGHQIAPLEALQRTGEPESIRSLDGRSLYPFQCAGVRFIEASGGRCLLGDEMGLGKTVQALATLKLHPEELPFLWVGKSSLKYQYQREVMRWLGETAFAQVITGSKSLLIPGLVGYIISYDLLRRMPRAFTSEIRERVRTIVLDECQQIKNSASIRTIHTRMLCSEIPNVIALSGTPVKNHAAEYFPVLNILKPEIFPRETSFVRWECDSYWNGYAWKTGGLAYPEDFKRKTKSFIIRRERKEVMPDLPTIDRQFHLTELSTTVERAYVETFKQFRADYNSLQDHHSFEDTTNIMAYLSRMRHIVGIAKIDPTIDLVMEFLGSTERKLVIFVHHIDVGQILSDKLNHVLKELQLEPVSQLTADLDPERRYQRVNEFENNPRRRILVASTLGFGEGLNLQFCSDCVLLERQWNPANEEQAEGRFPRPGSQAQSITCNYLIAVGTVDEFFSEIVERKREIISNTLGNESAPAWDQSSLMKELTETLAANGGQKWSI